MLRKKFGATNIELAMWIFTDDLQAWEFNSFDKCLLRFGYPVDGALVNSPFDAITLLTQKQVQFSESEINSFDPEKIEPSTRENEEPYCPGRYLSYLDAKAQVDAAAKARPSINLDGVHKAWKNIHAHFKDGKIDVKPRVIGYFPGGYGNIEDGFFRAAEIAKFIKHYIEDASPAPAQNTATPAPVVAVKHRAKKPSIETVALVYMRAEFKQGQFQSAAKFHEHLIKTATREESPFEIGTGTNARKLFCPEAGSFFDPGTLSKMWPKIRTV